MGQEELAIVGVEITGEKTISTTWIALSDDEKQTTLILNRPHALSSSAAPARALPVLSQSEPEVAKSYPPAKQFFNKIASWVKLSTGVLDRHPASYLPTPPPPSHGHTANGSHNAANPSPVFISQIMLHLPSGPVGDMDCRGWCC